MIKNAFSVSEFCVYISSLLVHYLTILSKRKVHYMTLDNLGEVSGLLQKISSLQDRTDSTDTALSSLAGKYVLSPVWLYILREN